MDGFEKRTCKTTRGYTYTYYTFGGDKSLPTLLLLHGFPDHAKMWNGIAGRLLDTKHPMIIPDQLGYDGTDKPTDPAEYRWDKITKDLTDILDIENAEKVIAIGHDWGSDTSARLYNYHPDRVMGCVFINVAYSRPTRQPFDIDEMNELTKKTLGFETFHYWKLFTDPAGGKVLLDNVDRLYQCSHGEGLIMRQVFGVPDGLPKWFSSNNPAPELRQYARDPKFRQEFMDRMHRDGFVAPLCWYRAAVDHDYWSDKELPESRDKVNVPVLYFGGKDDPGWLPDGMAPLIEQGFLPYLDQKPLLDSAHWTPYEKPEESAAFIKEWLSKNFSK